MDYYIEVCFEGGFCDAYNAYNYINAYSALRDILYGISACDVRCVHVCPKNSTSIYSTLSSGSLYNLLYELPVRCFVDDYCR